MLTRKQKEKIVEELADKIKRQKFLIFTDVAGINVSDIQNLRRELRKANIEYKVAKKTLIDLALKREKQEINIFGFNASLALAFSYNDSIVPAKILYNFSKEHENFKILGGIMEDKVLAVEDINELAKIPSKDELFGILVNGLKAPINGLVNVLQGNIRNLLLIFNQIKL